MSKYLDIHSPFPEPEKPPVENAIRNEFYSAICSYAAEDIERDMARYKASSERASAQATSAHVELHLVKDNTQIELRPPEEPFKAAS